MDSLLTLLIVSAPIRVTLQSELLALLQGIDSCRIEPERSSRIRRLRDGRSEWSGTRTDLPVWRGMLPNGQVAIVGVACRLPGGINSVGDLWSALATGCDLVSEAPQDRFDAVRLVDPVRGRKGKIASSAGGYLDDLTGFDAEFFGLSAAEASRIDPQQRIAMELAIEALDDAGIDPSSLGGSHAAVVMGASSFDYLTLQHNDLK